jgi:putative FmdB family regulatory protein
MPTYVYACDTCQVQFEKFQSFHDEPLRECPSCQSAVRRVLQPAGIVFKGSGWHITDYKGGKSAATSSASTSSDASSASSASDSAPAPATPTPAPESSAPPPAKSTDA